MNGTSSGGASFDPSAISRPDRSLLKYYFLIALLTGPAFPFAFLPLLFKYESLKYTFDEEGVSMRWGILFRREVHLAYRRIQDIHLTRNLIQRWMKLATVDIQTASGSAGPEMSIEGILEAEPLRDYLYAKMRGARGEPSTATSAASGDDKPPAVASSDEALQLLCEIRDALRQLASAKEEK
ncbi:MAG: PH domain-containing protein [Planctomycetes bacterium]|nr:PH domain-containing protein [Planctomycetota bacterium]